MHGSNKELVHTAHILSKLEASVKSTPLQLPPFHLVIKVRYQMKCENMNLLNALLETYCIFVILSSFNSKEKSADSKNKGSVDSKNTKESADSKNTKESADSKSVKESADSNYSKEC